ncbi:glycosyltransferase [Chiayiivirga flava]|uniref:Glycosyltransferase involved in cell wall biosynthesis n=1 Tax=Chiayiivirga flava TaxID=659595 RepID=A0A7W8G0A1_9GAMM|nr:glycosyltransferase [Chiayiivirga flava]MBB5208971.1 glycosyltransferase involved in cell wall biosynthesis [Chiayiivirga flava]
MRLLVAGFYANGPGYPNGRMTQAILSAVPGLEVVDLGYPMSQGLELWKIGKAGLVHAFSLVVQCIVLNARSALRVAVAKPGVQDLVYVRYPSVFFMSFISLFPRKVRPRCVVEAFIPVWDSMFNDRGRGRRGVRAQLVRYMESRSLRAAWRVIVDTEANADFVAQQLGVGRESVTSIPLAVEESAWRGVRHSVKAGNSFRVLFVGTLIRLHGLEVICEAIRLFRSGEPFEFVFVGDGQEAHTLRKLITDRPDLSIVWHREWIDTDKVAVAMADADVSLGVFGGKGKASRVLPFKVYMALAVGVPVVTQRDFSVPARAPAPPVVAVQPEASALAEAIRTLRGALDKRFWLHAEGRRYFDAYLSHEAVLRGWERVLTSRNVD